MTLATRNEDVFVLSGPEVFITGPLSLVEHRSESSRPVRVQLIYNAAAESRAEVELTWNPISEIRQQRGELVDFNLRLTRKGEINIADRLLIRFGFNSREAWDPIFATVGAAAFRIVERGDLRGVELCFGSNNAPQIAMPVPLRPISHFATGWRPIAEPADPYFELRLHLSGTAQPTELHIGRLFVGQHYDPYIYSPVYEYLAHLHGKPEFPQEAEVKAEFEAKARDGMGTGAVTHSQAYVSPFLVMREGKTRFPMLIGSVNALYWYGIDPRHTLEWSYSQPGYIKAGDIVLDCGAHAGQMSTFFGLIAGPAGKVVAFDPFPQNYYQVEAQAKLNSLSNLVSARAGVGTRAGRVRVSNGQQMTAGRDTPSISDEVEIDIVPLDDYIDLKPSFLKLDVEGAEVAALRGAQKLLRACKPKIFIEVHTQYLGRFGHSLTDLFAALPSDIYDTRFKVEGVDQDWRVYAPGLEQGVTRPILVDAFPK